MFRQILLRFRLNLIINFYYYYTQAERKAIANRILSEHRNDQIEKRQTKPSVARKIGDGGCAKMRDLLPEDGGGWG